MTAVLAHGHENEADGMAIQLGDVAKDTITGFCGVVVCETKWLHGCRRFTVQPRELHDGKIVEAMTFDEPQLELIEPGAAKGSSDVGGDRPAPMRRADPPRR